MMSSRDDLTPSKIDAYFKILGSRVNRSATVILTGVGAGSLLGNVRPSLDVDFGLIVKTPRGASKKSVWRDFEAAAREAGELTSLASTFAEDIDRWSCVTLLDYRAHTIFYKRFGRLEVRLLAPPYWAIGKLARWLDSDERDVVAVFRKYRPKPLALARLYGRALRESPLSDALFDFRKHVELFFKTRGVQVWGGKFSPDRVIAAFHKAAGIRP